MTFLNHYISKFLQAPIVLIGISIFFIIFEASVPQVYSNHFGVFDLTHTSTFIFFDMYTLFWYFAVPVVASKLFLRSNLKELGLVIPENKKMTVILIILALSFLLPYMLYFSTLPEFQGYSLASFSLGKFVCATGIFFPIYYFAEEFFFRGFLFIGLWQKVRWHSFWITDIIFTLAHVGKPGFEVLLCIPASVIFNTLTLCTRSIYPAIIVHSTTGIVLSVFVTYHLIGVHSA